MSTKRVLRIIQDTRKERYASLRGYFRGSEFGPDSEELPRLHAITVPEGVQAVGQLLHSLDLADLGVEVTKVRRGKDSVMLSPELVLQAGDVVVVRGKANCVGDAERKLLR